MSAARQLLRDVSIPRREAEQLLLACLGKDRAWLFAHDDEPIGAEIVDRYQALIARRQAGEPVAYVLGEREFWSLSFEVNDSVLIPRPDTETLVSWALEAIAAGGLHRVLELGTGSGAIAIAIASESGDCSVTATDVSAEALAVAQCNAERLGQQIAWRRSDWFGDLGGDKWSLIVSNPPYIRSDDPHLLEGDLPAEPRLALVAGNEGLECIRRIIEGAPEHMMPGGYLLLEHGWDQAEAVRKLLVEAGFQGVLSRADLAGHPRVTGGFLP